MAGDISGNKTSRQRHRRKYSIIRGLRSPLPVWPVLPQGRGVLLSNVFEIVLCDLSVNSLVLLSIGNTGNSGDSEYKSHIFMRL